MKRSKLITELTIDEFRKIAGIITVAEHRRHYFNKEGKEIGPNQIGEFVVDSQGNQHWINYEGIHSAVLWDNKSLLYKVEKAIEMSEKNNLPNRCICVAIHKKPSLEEIEDLMKEHRVDN